MEENRGRPVWLDLSLWSDLPLEDIKAKVTEVLQPLTSDHLLRMGVSVTRDGVPVARPDKIWGSDKELFPGKSGPITMRHALFVFHVPREILVRRDDVPLWLNGQKPGFVFGMVKLQWWFDRWKRPENRRLEALVVFSGDVNAIPVIGQVIDLGPGSHRGSLVVRRNEVVAVSINTRSDVEPRVYLPDDQEL